MKWRLITEIKKKIDNKVCEFKNQDSTKNNLNGKCIFLKHKVLLNEFCLQKSI